VHYIWTAQGKIEVGTTPEVLAEFGVSVSTLYRWEQEGMPVLREGRSKMFPMVAVRNWVTYYHGVDEHYGRKYPPLGI